MKYAINQAKPNQDQNDDDMEEEQSIPIDEVALSQNSSSHPSKLATDSKRHSLGSAVSSKKHKKSQSLIGNNQNIAEIIQGLQ